MKYTLFILIFSAQFATAQIRDFQLLGSTPKDTLWILGTDTTAAGSKRGLGKWYNAYTLINNLAVGGGGGATNLSIAQSGGTQVIQSSTGTDVGVRNLYGLLITEGATDTLHFRVDTGYIATLYDITQIPISSLKAATATNTINNANYAQEWQWNTLAGVSGLKLSSTSTAAASSLQKLFEVSLSGANSFGSQSTYAGYFSNTHIGGASSNYGIYSAASGGSVNIGITAATTGSGYAVYANTTSGKGVYSFTTTGLPLQLESAPTSTSTIVNIADLYRNTTGTAANGIGGSITFTTQTATSSAVSNTISSKWTTATHASRVSDFIISGVNAATTADLLTIKGSGKLVAHKYGAGTFTGTPVADIFVTASGEFIEGSMTGQSWTADADDATTPVLVSNQTLKFGGAAGIVTDLFNPAGTPDSITFAVDGSEWTTTSIYESDDWMQMYDAGSAQLQRINQANFITELNSLLTVSGDGNGIYGGDGTTPADVDVTMTDNIDFGGGALFIDDANGEIGIGTNSPDYGLDLESNTANFHIKDLNGGSGAQISIESVQETGVVAGMTFQYTDSDYAGGALQQPYAIEVNRRVDDKQSSTFLIDAQDATNASVFIAQKNEDFSDNTTESAIAINGGIAFTQNYDISTSGNLTLDRSYYILNVTGGALGDTIKLPEVASTSDNWDSALTTAQAQVGQEFLITNFRSATNVVISAHNPTSGNSDLINSQTNITGASAISIPANSSVQVKCVRLASGVGYWYSY